MTNRIAGGRVRDKMESKSNRGGVSGKETLAKYAECRTIKFSHKKQLREESETLNDSRGTYQ